MAQVAVIRDEIPIPEGIEVTIQDEIVIKGSKGELKRKFKSRNIKISQDDNKIILEAPFPKKRDKAMLGTIKSHLNNMITGLTDGFTYQMKIVYAHFPMTVKVANSKVTIENFLGERHPRSAKILGDTKVQVKGDEVTVLGINKEDVGQTMANIEQATKIKGRDPRVFQDGIYLISKEG
ncbi:MAG: 50S ribosomal protein L6 [Methanobacterium sp.]|jgi:large subunit ribosomal protein L6|nr:50S ribosomal protein L6 [Methanobacterium sp.]